MDNSKMQLSDAEKSLRDAAFEYHRAPTFGKISVTPTKALSNQRDLSLAYSPGVAYPCLAIEADPNMAAEYTSRGNLVGVVTNGTAVLGLGDIGPLAAKPVMEGKGCLFKKFAGIDVFDIELAEKDPKKLVEIIAALEPTLGGVNLEDIKAPECFYIEKALKERMKIPVFHDDQHGTAIISGAALLNGLELVGKPIEAIRLVSSGAGAAAIACLDIMVGLGVKLENIFVVDSRGVIQHEREDARSGKLDESKQRYCQKTAARTLADVVSGCDVFLGCSAAGVLTPEMVGTMAPRPIILALANPEPEIRPELAKQARPDCIVATGRSDYPNQVNNVLCFPVHLPRRARLRGDPHHRGDEARVRARDRGAGQGRAQRRGRRGLCRAGAALRARLHHPDAVRLAPHPADRAGGGEGGGGERRRDAADRRHRRLPALARPLRLPDRHGDAAAVRGREVQAGSRRLCRGRGRPRPARDPGGARRRPRQADPDRPAGRHAGAHPARRPAPAARPDFEVVNPEDDPRHRAYSDDYHGLMGRQGITPEMAKAAVRRSNTLIAAMMIRRGDADAMLAGRSAATRATSSTCATSSASRRARRPSPR